MISALLLLSLAIAPFSEAFGGIGEIGHAISSFHHSSANNVALPFLQNQSTIAALEPSNLLQQYKRSLETHPLATKMVTGGTLAVMGDAIAQSRTNNSESPPVYDTTRAFSFMVFDMCYRALQHVSFPTIVQTCKGQYLGGLIDHIPLLSQYAHSVSSETDLYYYLGAMEQTLASQLGIVPFLYYPVFFSLTGFIQGLTLEGSLQRAQENFLPLMKRNLLFWIPVQFIQFGFIEEGLQIPFLSVCGLAWTFILSVMAGSAKSFSSKPNENVRTTFTYNLDDQEQQLKIYDSAIKAQVEAEKIATRRQSELKAKKAISVK
mmetsp:Transcript_1203/g.1693  ORF Transcript_1203/g.1693 Transcript_1203/m.1693 type:complete len:319 (-) Transcript_1203:203-1159(-)|eukprot:CAMPEP_0184867608 /NCGR_PEP_ID=MMETSP0580-20130426/27241_1 /TAXON_ID=1118495 /ORGANISM="Dactyliosolen fragilissimus" /LENGTH=318 /DNA_ID=CAMNT_0027367999 /DNA_START=229 /DNA_END=1185 /DNA_ORIENTATION=+